LYERDDRRSGCGIHGDIGYASLGAHFLRTVGRAAERQRPEGIGPRHRRCLSARIDPEALVIGNENRLRFAEIHAPQLSGAGLAARADVNQFSPDIERDVGDRYRVTLTLLRRLGHDHAGRAASFRARYGKTALADLCADPACWKRRSALCAKSDAQHGRKQGTGCKDADQRACVTRALHRLSWLSIDRTRRMQATVLARWAITSGDRDAPPARRTE
jgi:hypothetical protein